MGSRRISGITIEIDGNTTKLNDSLKSVDKQLDATKAALRDVNSLLKFDTKNPELLRQKQRRSNLYMTSAECLQKRSQIFAMA